MASAFHATKLHRPAPRPAWVRRPRLYARLDRALEQDHRLILVSAPAGSGKTTLLAEWIAGRESRAAAPSARATQSRISLSTGLPIRFAWLSLDESDDDPARFWAAVLLALQSAAPGLGGPILAALESAQPPPLPALLPALFNSIGGYEGRLVLVLDDYHVLSAPVVHETVAQAIERLPGALALAIVTRSDPPLPLGRLRARDQLTEIRAADLRFTADEAAAFLNERMSLSLEDGDVAALVERTEGWAAGLQLAGLSLQGQPDPGPQIRAFTGSHHYVLEYLVEEVLGRQPEETQTFLLRTSILDRLCAPLCDALLGTRKGQATLDYLNRANLFVVPLDAEHRWYRYHHLFADLLRARLEGAEPEAVGPLHLAAAQWYDRNGYAAEAVRHAFAAPDYEAAAEMIERNGHERWSLSDRDFLSLASKLPAPVLQARPVLGVYQAWMGIIYARFHDSEKLLAAIRQRIPADHPDSQAMLSFIDLLLAYIADFTGAGDAIPLPDAGALDYVPEGRLAMRNSADVVYASMLMMRGRFAEASETLWGTLRRDSAAGGTTAIGVAVPSLARMAIIEGRLHDAERLLRDHAGQVKERGAWQFYLPGSLNVTLADVLREWGQLEAAEREARAGIELNAAWASPHAAASGGVTLARIQLSQGRGHEAAETIQQVEAATQGRTLTPDTAAALRAVKARAWLSLGDLAAARRWAETVSSGGPFTFRLETDHISLARIMLAEGRAGEAGRLLGELGREAAAAGRRGREIEIRLQAALAWWAGGQTQDAFRDLARSLALAEPEGYLRTFLDEREAARGLLAAYLRSGAAGADRAYASRLLAAFGASPTQQPPHPPAHGAPQAKVGSPAEPLVEPLTPRELEVLGLIAAGDSNQAIADRLVITVSAVKKHTGNIFGKLGVSSRTQAAARARELRLLAED